jgi:hypothetical protein
VAVAQARKQKMQYFSASDLKKKKKEREKWFYGFI